MSWLADHWVLAVLLALYTALLLRNAQIGMRRSASAADYFVGGRNMGGAVVGISFFATFASTNSYIGHAGKGYAYGLPWMMLAVLIVLFTYLSWRFVGPRLRAFAERWDALTLPDYLASRFPGPGAPLMRMIAALVIVVSSILYLVAIFKGAGNLFERFLEIPYTASVGLTLVIVVLYTSVGGFISVVRTDVLQGLLMVLGSATIFFFVTQAAGGVGRLPELAERPTTEHLFELNGAIPFAVLLGISLSGSLKLLVDPRQLSRFFALRDERQARAGVWVAVLGLVLVQFLLFPVGVYAHFLLDGVADTDTIVPTLISDPNVFPPAVADFLIVAIIAAAMSSMDSVLLVAASVLYKDLAVRIRPSLPAIGFTRLAVVGFAVVSAAIALNPPGGIVEITIFSGSLYAVCFLPAVLLGLHWQRGSAKAVIGSMLIGISTLLLWLLAGLQSIVHEVFPALLVSLVTYTLLSLREPARVLPITQRSPGR